MAEETVDPYQLLGVARDADAATISKAYRRLARTCHPDVHPGDVLAAARFRELTEAYEVLSDARKRALFDETGDMGRAMRPRESETVLQQIFDQMIAAHPAPTDDIVAFATQKVRADIRKFREATVQLEGGLVQLRASEKLAVYKGKGRNLLELVFAAKINANEQAIAHNTDAIKIGEEMLEMLRDYEAGAKALTEQPTQQSGFSWADAHFTISGMSSIFD